MSNHSGIYCNERPLKWRWWQQPDLWNTRICTWPQKKSNHHHQHTSNQMFYRQDALPAAQPTASKHWRRCKHLKACWLHHAWLPIRCLSHRALALAAGKWSPNVISDGQNPKHNWFLSRDFKWFHNSICTIKIQFEPVWFDLQFNSKISQIGLKKI